MSTNIKTIGLDVDGCLRNFLDSLVTVFKRHYPQQKIVSFDHYQVYKAFPGLSEAEVDHIWKDLYPVETIHTYAHPYPGAAEAVRYLRRMGYKTNIVTYQDRNILLEHTIKWLKKHKIKYDALFNTSKKYEADFDVLIEDNGKYITDVVNNGKKVIIMDHPYNRNLDKDVENKCVRVQNWDQVIEIFEDLGKIEKFVKTGTSFAYGR